MSDSNVVELDLVTKLDIPVERVLRRAQEADLQSVVVLGYDANGEEYFCSSISDGGSVVWLIERAKLNLLRTCDKDG